MLARDYLAFVTATLGYTGAREDRLKNRGFSGNHDLFVAPDGWLDHAPSAAQVLAMLNDELGPEYQAVTASYKAFVEGAGVPVSKTPYARYNTAP